MIEKRWDILFEDVAYKEFAKLDRASQKKIQTFIRTRLEPAIDPKIFGKPLAYHLKGYWRFRVENWRLLCRIEEDRLIITVVRMGHRREIYD